MCAQKSRTFRESAVNEYMQRSQDSVIPAFAGSVSSTFLWFVGMAFVITTIVSLHLIVVPRQASVTVVVDKQSELLVSTLTDEMTSEGEFRVMVDPLQPPVEMDDMQLVKSERESADIASNFVYPMGRLMLEELGDTKVSVYETRRAKPDLSSGIYLATAIIGESSLLSLILERNTLLDRTETLDSGRPKSGDGGL